METEVWKPKYRSEKKSHLLVFSTLLSHNCVCWGLVAKGWLYPCDVRAGSWDLGLSLSWCKWLPVSVARPKLRLTVEWANHAGSMLLMLMWQWCRCEHCHSFSPRIFSKGSTNHRTTPETLPNSHHSLEMRPRQDYTHRIMINDCVSVHWSLMCQYSTLTLFGYSQQ